MPDPTFGLPPFAKPASAPPQFTQQHLRQVHDAQFQFRRIARAISVARFDAWTLLIFGVASMLFGVWSLTSLVVGAGLTLFSVIEFKQADRLKRMEGGALENLAKNQLGLAMLLMLYASYMIYQTVTGPSPLTVSSASDPAVAEMLQPYQEMVRTLTLSVYAGLIVVAIGAQGGMAFYYFTRRKHLLDYLTQTPAWLVDMQRAGMRL